MRNSLCPPEGLPVGDHLHGQVLLKRRAAGVRAVSSRSSSHCGPFMTIRCAIRRPAHRRTDLQEPEFIAGPSRPFLAVRPAERPLRGAPACGRGDRRPTLRPRTTPTAAASCSVLPCAYDGLSYQVTRLAYDTSPPIRGHSLDAALDLPRNPLPESDLVFAERHELTLQGGMMGAGRWPGRGKGALSPTRRGMLTQKDLGPGTDETRARGAVAGEHTGGTEVPKTEIGPVAKPRPRFDHSQLPFLG